MMKKWKSGDIFLVPNSDGKFTPGQIIAEERRTLHCASCAFFDQRVSSVEEGAGITLKVENCFSALLVTEDNLDENLWPVVSRQPIILPRKMWPYEELLSKGKKVGTTVRGSGIVMEFLDAFYGLRPWDGWYRRDYLDQFLLCPDKKPNNLIFSKS